MLRTFVAWTSEEYLGYHIALGVAIGVYVSVTSRVPTDTSASVGVAVLASSLISRWPYVLAIALIYALVQRRRRRAAVVVVASP